MALNPPPDLPTRTPSDSPLPGPHVIVHPDGMVQYVFAGPNTLPLPRRTWRDRLAPWMGTRVERWFILAGATAVACSGGYGWVWLAGSGVCAVVVVLRQLPHAVTRRGH